MHNNIGKVGVLIILVGIISAMSISQLGQVIVPEQNNAWVNTPGCEFITGECCPGDPMSIVNCNDGDACTDDLCVVNGLDGECKNTQLPGCSTGGGNGTGDGGAIGTAPGPPPLPGPIGGTDGGLDGGIDGGLNGGVDGGDNGDNGSDGGGNACSSCTESLCSRCGAKNQGCYAREEGGSTVTDCFSTPRSGWDFCCGSQGGNGGDDGGDDGGNQPECGNGDTEEGEECDDGNTSNTDGCTNDCKSSSCGDGFKQHGEWCDDGEDNSDTEPDACRTDCTPAGCGDGILDSDELCECGLGEGVTPQYCSTTNAKTPYGNGTQVRCWSSSCNLSHYCGNGVEERDGLVGQRYTEDDEECDDGNRDDGDGCSASCKLVNMGCGNGNIDQDEECDLGAKCAVSGASCNDCHASKRNTCCGKGDWCVIQGGQEGKTWGDVFCTSSCTYGEILCGNGRVDTGVEHSADEECDPGANQLGKGSAQCREGCYLPLCGDGVVDNSEGSQNGYQRLEGHEEECDNGSKCVGISKPDGEKFEGMDCYHLWVGGGGLDKVSDYLCEAFGGTCEPQDGDGCDSQCKSEGQVLSSASSSTSSIEDVDDEDDGTGPECGNGIREGNEQCDEGDRNSDDTEAACRKDCTSGTCGNGQIETNHGEECDCGPIVTTNCITQNAEGIGILCKLSCTGDYCGDNKVYSKGMDDKHRTMDDEVCDAGDSNSDEPNAACRTDCKPARCGDGIVDSGEQCDSGEMRCADGSLCDVLDPVVTRWIDTCIWNPAFPSNQGSCKAVETSGCDKDCQGKDLSQSSSSSSSLADTGGGDDGGDDDNDDDDEEDEDDQDDNDDGNTSSSSSSSSSTSTPGPSHAVCDGSSCKLVAGAGRNECVLSLGCGEESHLECSNNACLQIGGAGPHKCHPQLGCGTHTACINNACVTIKGPGPFNCTNDTDCEHVESVCRDGILEGDEECEAAIDCVSPLRTCDIQTCTCPLKPKSSSISSSSTSNIFSSSQKSTIIAFSSSSDNSLQIITALQNKNSAPEETLTLTEESLVASAVICGNGTLEPPEECDDRNRRDNDGCNSVCLLELGICGDGIVQSLLGEQCESSLHDSDLPYQCQQCRFLSLTCGDEVIDAGEECDDGNRNSASPDANCRPDCSGGRCGDGITDSVETCDDGNRISNDGCDRFCRIEEEDTLIASDTEEEEAQESVTPQAAVASQFQGYQQYNFPQRPTYNQLPFQLPLAQLQPLIATQGPVGDTGPAAVAVIGAGAAAGFSWIRRKRK